MLLNLAVCSHFLFSLSYINSSIIYIDADHTIYYFESDYGENSRAFYIHGA